MKPNLSIIIPVKKGEDTWKSLLKQLDDPALEIIFVGPEFDDNIEGNLKTLKCVGNRATKLNLGALQAGCSSLFFLHADSILPSNFQQTILNALKKNPNKLYHFELEFDGSPLMKINSWGANWRSRYLKMPFGDQGFFTTKKVFFELGFFSEIAPYGEDHLLVWRAHQLGIKVECIDERIKTSSRKYKNAGWLTTTVKHVYLTYKQAFPELLKIPLNRFEQHPYAFAIFVKTPGFSSLKTRLAQTIGKEKAEEFFTLSVMATEEVLAHVTRMGQGKIKVYWAVSEENALDHELWKNFTAIHQGVGELGDRLHTIQKKLRDNHRYYFFIGADSPHVRAHIYHEATSKLQTHDHVLGKTEDGGFYLYASDCDHPLSFWKSINYSVETTADELVAKIPKHKLTFLENLFDIDYVEDLKRLAAVDQEDLLPAQKRVIQWAKNLS